MTRPMRSDLHIHTNESFSVFRSPTEAVWQAVTEGVAVLGINDHYTCAGHDEFRQACEQGLGAGRKLNGLRFGHGGALVKPGQVDPRGPDSPRDSLGAS